jgi:aspartyl-tRNA(Asn)/glutamyl-tRNA(Gln) amidotransferase subunit A
MIKDLRTLTATEAVAGIKDGVWTSRALTEAVLSVARAAKDRTNAYVTLCEDLAIAAADAADKRYKAGKPLSEIDGVPIAVKDIIMVEGVGATASSAILKDYVAPYDATVTKRLKAAGAVIVGKTNMDEFAMGSSTESSVHGPTRNPWDLSRVPGGSSGGSAAAVSEGSAVIALGTDTGGSIRQPAAMTGTVGMKPTYGRVSRYGTMAMASSLDQIGPFARSVDDVAALLRVIEGKDPQDATSVPLQKAWNIPEHLSGDVKGLRIGLPKECFGSGNDPDVEKSVRDAVAKLEQQGAVIKEISLPHNDRALAVYYILMPCEVSANLARFDGVRYGKRITAGTLEETYRETRRQGLGAEVRRRIMLGTYALSSGYYDAYYLKAQKVRRIISNDYAAAFQDVDVIITPTSPSVAWKLGEKVADPLAMYLMDIFTVSVNVAGLPGISLPCGTAQGLPVGIQVIGKHFDDATVLRTAKAIEMSVGWLAGGNVPQNA